MKICTKCKIQRNEEDFAWKSKIKGTRTAECKECHRLYNKAYYISNTEKEKDRIYSFRDKRRLELHRLAADLKLKCKNCPESRPAALQFHHLGDKERDISAAIVACWSNDKLLAEIAKCEVICANCHMVEHFGDKYEETICLK